MKAGTTALYRHLLHHPEIAMSTIKETNYFVAEKNWSRGQSWYDSLFVANAPVTGEVSPAYAKHDIFPDVPARIAAFQPSTQIVFLARDPVKRFVSHYRHARVLGHTDVAPENLLSSRNGQHMLETSRYAAQLSRYLLHFPREQILVLDFEELATDPQQTLDRVSNFLGVSSHSVKSDVTRNDIQTLAAMPKSLQKLWQIPAMRKLDGLIDQRSRDVARKLLSRRKVAVPEVPEGVRSAAAELLTEDARRFRDLTKLPFPHWSI